MSGHDFAPYQDRPPERLRSPAPRSPPPTGIRSPRASLEQSRSKNIGTQAVGSPRSNNGGGYFDSPAGWGGARSPGYNDGTGEQSPGAVIFGHDAPGAWANEGAGVGGGSRGWTSGREDIDMFETRLGLRMDYEACLAYLLLPPAGGVLLLVLEHRSDYVRFHAWQSSLLFSVIFIVHVIFSWSAVISYLMLAGDLALIGYLTFRAYHDADNLERFEIPFFGPLASSILDDE